MAGLLRVTILNNLPAKLDTIYERVNAPEETINAMLTELIDKGRIEVTAYGTYVKVK